MTYAAPDNSTVQTQNQDMPWKERCSFGCYNAKGKRKKCKCRCGGKLHGKSHREHTEKLRIAELEERPEKQ